MSNNSPPRRTPAAPLFAALGDETRLRLLEQLGDGEARSIANLSIGNRMTRQAITKHLRVLENVGLVSSSHVGRESHYRFRGEPIANLRTYLDSVSKQWESALERLRIFVEEPPAA